MAQTSIVQPVRVVHNYFSNDLKFWLIHNPPSSSCGWRMVFGHLGGPFGPLTFGHIFANVPKVCHQQRSVQTSFLFCILGDVLFLTFCATDTPCRLKGQYKKLWPLAANKGLYKKVKKHKVFQNGFYGAFVFIQFLLPVFFVGQNRKH